MFKKITLFRNHPLGVILFLISLYLCYANYTPGTFLTGWDTLHPEFNFNLYWTRILDGVWQEHQSLGAVASQAHASEIPRVLILMLLDLLLPLSAVRYSYAFLMLCIGAMGVYTFIKLGVLKEQDAWVRETAGFAGGLYYLFNLGTLQHFYVPLEMFLTHYGFIGWLFLTLITYLKSGTKRALIWFSVVTLFMSSQAHTPTLFYALFLYLTAYMSLFVMVHKCDREVVKRSFIIIFATLVINLFWLLPGLYFAVTHGSEIQESKIHLLFSVEAFLQNKEFGDAKNTPLLKNFLFNWGEYVGHNEFGELLDEWKYHLERPFVTTLGYIFFALSVAGLIVAIIKREKVLAGVGLMAGIGVFFIFNVNPPLGGLFMWFQDNIPLFKEAFRFPFTKFSIGLMFCYSVFFAYFVSYVVDRWVNFKKIMSAALSALLLISFYYYCQPMFRGGLVSPSMRVNIPQRYFDMFEYFKSQKEYGRVLNLPIHSFWGWTYQNWDAKTTLGYQGAGFLWFGIQQPLINREFDRWNLANERPYMEISTAIYSKDSVTLEKLLNKYKVRWILVDRSVVAPGQDVKQLFYPQIFELLSSSQKIRLEKDFGQGLMVYRYYPAEDFSSRQWLGSYYQTGDSTFKEFTDPIYNAYGNYAGGGENNYPFVGITKYDESINDLHISSDPKYIYLNNGLEPSPLSVDYKDSSFQYKVTLQKSGEDYKLVFDPVETSFDIDFQFDLGKVGLNAFSLLINETIFYFDGIKTELGSVLLNPQREVRIKILTENGDIFNMQDFWDTLENCSLVGDQTSYSMERTAGGFALLAQNVDACVTVDLEKYIGNPGPDRLFELSVKGQSENNRQEVCVLDNLSGLCLNQPISEGKTFFRTEIGKNYSLRLFARGNRAANHEVRVEYSDLGLFALRNVGDLTVLPAISLNQNPYVDTWRFEKNRHYSGLVTSIPNYPRACKSGNMESDKSRILLYSSSEDPYIRYESHGEDLCDSFEFPTFEYGSGAILEIRSRNREGIPLRVCLTNENSKRCDLYVSLSDSPNFTTQYYMVPPMGSGRGYTLNISNLIFGDSVSINDLQYVALVPFPYSMVKSMHRPLQAGSNLLVYNEAFETGWTAWCGLGLCRSEHVKVNNWSNGWVFDNSVPLESVVIIFWPQLLEYIGIVASVIWFLLFISNPPNNRK